MTFIRAAIRGPDNKPVDGYIIAKRALADSVREGQDGGMGNTYSHLLTAMHKKMIDKLILIGRIICFGCTDKKGESEPGQEQSKKSEISNYTFKIVGNVILKEYLGEEERIVTEEEKTYFETVDHEDILIQIKQRTLNHRLADKPDYRLNLRAYKTPAKKYVISGGTTSIEVPSKYYRSSFRVRL